MAQFARPDADTSAGNWSASSGSSLYAMVDETSANDSDYITVSDGGGGAEACTLRLSDVGDPGDHTSTSVVVRSYTDSFYSSVTLNVNLRDGSTSIKNEDFTPGTSFGNHTMNLSTTQAGNISDYTDLNIIITATDSMGMGSETRISHVYFTCPDLGPINVTPAHASAASSGQVSAYVEYSLPATAATSALSPTVVNESLPAIAAASGQDPTVTVSMPDIEVTVQAISASSAVVNSHIVNVVVASAASSGSVQTQTVNASATAAASAEINIISWSASASASASALRTTSYVMNSIASATASAAGDVGEDLFISGIQATAVASAKLGTEVISGVVASSAATALHGVFVVNPTPASAAATVIKLNSYVVGPVASGIAGALSTAGVSVSTIQALPATFRSFYNISEEDAAEGEAPAGEEIRSGDGAGLYAYLEGFSIVTGPTAVNLMHFLRGRDGVTIYADDVGNIKFCTGYGIPDRMANVSNTYLSMSSYETTKGDVVVVSEDDSGNIIVNKTIT